MDKQKTGPRPLISRNIKQKDWYSEFGINSIEVNLEQTKRNYSYSVKQIAYLLAEGVGVNGTFFMQGAVSVIGKELFVNALGRTYASNMGKAIFRGNANVSSKNYNQTRNFEWDGYSLHTAGWEYIGSAKFTLPDNSNNFRLSINTTYTLFDSAGEFMGVPIPTYAKYSRDFNY